MFLLYVWCECALGCILVDGKTRLLGSRHTAALLFYLYTIFLVWFFFEHCNVVRNALPKKERSKQSIVSGSCVADVVWKKNLSLMLCVCVSDNGLAGIYMDAD